MTLDFSKTASDVALMDAIGPQLIQAYEAADRFVTMAEFRSILQPLIRALPDTPYWSRTRHRASTSHGAYDIQRTFKAWAHGRWPAS